MRCFGLLLALASITTAIPTMQNFNPADFIVDESVHQGQPIGNGQQNSGDNNQGGFTSGTLFSGNNNPEPQNIFSGNANNENIIIGGGGSGGGGSSNPGNQNQVPNQPNTQFPQPGSHSTFFGQPQLPHPGIQHQQGIYGQPGIHQGFQQQPHFNPYQTQQSGILTGGDIFSGNSGQQPGIVTGGTIFTGNPGHQSGISGGGNIFSGNPGHQSGFFNGHQQSPNPHIFPGNPHQPQLGDSKLGFDDIGQIQGFHDAIGTKCRFYDENTFTNQPDCLANGASRGCKWVEQNLQVGVTVRSGFCICKRRIHECQKEERCYWYKDKREPRNSLCISSAERFYKLLKKLLEKRGKQDFAIRIQHKTAAARGVLPYGPHGPAIYGFGADHFQGYDQGGYNQGQGYQGDDQGYGQEGYGQDQGYEGDYNEEDGGDYRDEGVYGPRETYGQRGFEQTRHSHGSRYGPFSHSHRFNGQNRYDRGGPNYNRGGPDYDNYGPEPYEKESGYREYDEKPVYGEDNKQSEEGYKVEVPESENRESLYGSAYKQENRRDSHGYDAGHGGGYGPNRGFGSRFPFRPFYGGRFYRRRFSSNGHHGNNRFNSRFPEGHHGGHH